MTQDKSPIDSQSSTNNKNLIANHQTASEAKSFWFSVCFAGHMDMYSDAKAVVRYLNAHEDWFCRCAKPMKVESIGENGYILNVGRFGSLGYEVEPKIAVVLDPPQDDLYIMRTVPIPDYENPGYEVQYKALMELEEISEGEVRQSPTKNLFGKKTPIPSILTRVSWQLDLAVTVDFPKFIEKFPTNLIQSTGDRLLAQIVRQISPRLTYKVQHDFHTSRNLSIPGKNSRGLSKMARECDFVASNELHDTVTSDLSNRVQKDNNRAA